MPAGDVDAVSIDFVARADISHHYRARAHTRANTQAANHAGIRGDVDVVSSVIVAKADSHHSLTRARAHAHTPKPPGGGSRGYPPAMWTQCRLLWWEQPMVAVASHARARARTRRAQTAQTRKFVCSECARDVGGGGLPRRTRAGRHDLRRSRDVEGACGRSRASFYFLYKFKFLRKNVKILTSVGADQALPRGRGRARTDSRGGGARPCRHPPAR